MRAQSGDRARGWATVRPEFVRTSRSNLRTSCEPLTNPSPVGEGPRRAFPAHRVPGEPPRAQSPARRGRPALARHRQPRRHRAPTGPVALDRLQPRHRSAGDRPGRGARGGRRPRRRPGRPPADAPGARPRRRRHRRHRLRRTATCASPSADLSSTVLAETAAEIDVDERRATRPSTPRPTLVGRAARRGRPRPRPDRSARASACPARSTATSGRVQLADDPARLAATCTRPRRSRRRLGLPVHLDNDANVGALGESAFGAGAGAEVMVYLRLSAGIGAGLVLGGALVPRRRRHRRRDRPRARRSRRPDLPLRQPRLPGDVRVRRRRCVELLRRSHGAAHRAEMVRLAPRTATPACQRVIADAGRVVGRALADLCNYLNPELIVIGGELAPGRRRSCSTRCAKRSRRYAIPAAADGRRRRGRRARGARRGARRARPGRRTSRTSPLPVPLPAMSHQSMEEEEQVMHSQDVSTDAARSARCARAGHRGRRVRRRRRGLGRRRQQQRRRGRQKVAVLLPDTKSSVRWETSDRPLLQKAFKDAGVPVTIQNAQGDKSTQQQQAEQADHQRREGAPADEPRLGLGRGDPGQRQVARRQGHRLRPPHAQGLRPTTTCRSTTCTSASSRARASWSAWARSRWTKPDDRRAQRLADGQQRDPVQAGLRLGARPDVRGGRVQEGRRPVRARLGQPAGADDLRADAAEDRTTRSTACSRPTTASATR